MSWLCTVKGNTCAAVRMWWSFSMVKGNTCEAVRMWQSSSTVRAEMGAWWALHMAMAAPVRPSRQAACPELSPAAAVLAPRATALTEPPACSSMQQHVSSLRPTGCLALQENLIREDRPLFPAAAMLALRATALTEPATCSTCPACLPLDALHARKT